MQKSIDWLEEVGPRFDVALQPSPWEECQSFGGGLDCALRRLHTLGALETRWRASVETGRDRYDPAVDHRFLDRYRTWLDVARKVADELDRNGSDSCYAERAARFRAALEDVEDLVEQRELRATGQALQGRCEANLELSESP